MTPLARRSLLAWSAALGLAPAAARAAGFAKTSAPEPVPISLWPGLPPGAPPQLPMERIVDLGGLPDGPNRVVDGIARPALLHFAPARPTSRAAVMLMPGGSYVRQVVDREGLETVRLLNARGIAAFVLRYRLPGDGWSDRALAPLQDAQRALRLLRARAPTLGIDPARIAVLGFSAGGHLAASLAARHALPAYRAVDEVDAVSARPDVAGLLYPVIGMESPLAHARSTEALLGPDPSVARRADYSVQRHVDRTAPPTILVHAADDPSVPVDNSLAMFAALRAAAVSAELHIFEKGGHGFGVAGAAGLPAAAWPELFLAFANTHGLLSPR